jgi:UrcA family protein
LSVLGSRCADYKLRQFAHRATNRCDDSPAEGAIADRGVDQQEYDLMTKFALSAILAASASFLAVAPAAAEEFPVQISYAHLDLASPAGAKVLAQRVDAACERPDIRDLAAVSAWQACKDAARTSAMDQLNSKGVAFDSTAFIGA